VSRSVQGAHFQPQLVLNIALVIERQDGTSLTVLDDQLQLFAVPHDYNRLQNHIEEVTELANRLLESAGAELGVQLVPLDAAGVSRLPNRQGTPHLTSSHFR
jgi:hypothetical protein